MSGNGNARVFMMEYAFLRAAQPLVSSAESRAIVLELTTYGRDSLLFYGRW